MHYFSCTYVYALLFMHKFSCIIFSCIQFHIKNSISCVQFLLQLCTIKKHAHIKFEIQSKEPCNLLLLATESNHSDLLLNPDLVKQSASCRSVGTQSTELIIPIPTISFILAMLFLSNFSSHCFVLCILSHKDLLSVKAWTGVCPGFFKSIFVDKPLYQGY